MSRSVSAPLPCRRHTRHHEMPHLLCASSLCGGANAGFSFRGIHPQMALVHLSSCLRCGRKRWHLAQDYSALFTCQQVTLKPFPEDLGPADVSCRLLIPRGRIVQVLFPFFCHMLLFTELGTGCGLAASSPSEFMPINASNCIPTNSISCLILIESSSDTVKPSISPVTFGKAVDSKDACQSWRTALVRIEAAGF